MSKKKLDQTHSFDDEVTEENEIIRVSKSEIKRDAEEIKKFGIKLVNLSSGNLKKIPMEEKLADAVQLARVSQKGALRRQLQYIGKLLRQMDIEPIRQALEKIENKHNQQQIEFHQVEQLRDKLIAEGDIAIAQLLDEYPQFDRQHLRNLVRNAQREQKKEKGSPKYYREIFQYLKHEIINK